MNDLFFDLGVSAILTTLRNSIKNNDLKRKVRRVMLKIYTKIGEVYADEIEHGEFK